MNIDELKRYYQKNKRKILALILISVIFFMWIFSKYQSEVVMRNALQQGCLIDYGYPKCYDGKLYIPFFNPNKRDITFVKISIPVKTGTNIYNVNESLKSGKSSALPTIDCEKDMNTNNFELMWCCNDKCFETKMNKPSKDVQVKIR